MPSISHRALAFPDSPIRKLTPLADAARAKGLSVLGLNIGQPDIPTPPQFVEALHGYDAKVVAYGRSDGEWKLREALAGYYAQVGLAVEPSQIIITMGGSEAILFALQITCEAGDEVLCFEPFYTNYNAFARMCGVVLKAIPTDGGDGFHLPAEEAIRAALSPRTRAIILCSPNNPTGTVLRDDEMALIARIAEEANLFVISDEVYREFVYEGRHTSVLAVPGLERRAILVDSLSKRYSACGARVGCFVSRHPEVLAAAVRIAQGRLCPPAAEQHAAAALANLGLAFFDPIREEYRRRRDVCFDGLMAIPGVRCRRPAGAFYIMADLPVPDADAFAKWLLTDFQLDGETVLVAPGAGFYSEAGAGLGRSQVRLAYVLEEAKLRRAMTCLKAAVEAYSALPVSNSTVPQ
jgi:aspartate aminotransferase